MVHAIAKITNTSGLGGEVKLRPLSRYSIDYIMTKDLHIGQIENNLSLPCSIVIALNVVSIFNS